MNLRTFRIIDMLKYLLENPKYSEEIPNSINTRMVANIFSLFFKFQKSSLFAHKIQELFIDLSRCTISKEVNQKREEIIFYIQYFKYLESQNKK